MAPITAPEPTDQPGVVALPPVVYLVGMIAGFALNVFVPLRLSLPPIVRWLGVALMIGSVVLGVVARNEFARAGTDVNPTMPSTALVTSGPFRWSRNPMYVAMTVLLAGLALFTRIAWILIALVPVLAIIHWGVVLREERYLSRKFGADYEALRSRVRRYL